MTRMLWTILVVLAGLAAFVGCGGSDESAQTSTVVIDTSSLPTDDAVTRALAAEHGAPGDNEQLQYVLVGENAHPNLVALLQERGFTNVGVGGR